MFAIRSLVKNNAQVLKNVAQQRNMSVVSIPARTKVTKGEMIFLSGLMLVSWCAIPAWVLVNLKHYRGE
uniref:Cytochrome c oxidase polypeptide VIII n=1 Tax=Papilio polytes TaxID=76194 RepID=I4DN62_PAPPL|nr:unknown unsecreted protein [Papilio polytes]